jgi:putative sigma-54 modulation protein
VEITVTGRHPTITPEMRAYAEDKVSKMTRIFDRLTRARITLEVDGADHRAEASVHGPRGAVLVAHATSGDMFTALDEMESRLESQLRKFKTRIEQRRHADDGVPHRAPELAG